MIPIPMRHAGRRFASGEMNSEEQNPPWNERVGSSQTSLGLAELFKAEDDEVAILSICAARANDADRWRLSHAITGSRHDHMHQTRWLPMVGRQVGVGVAIRLVRPPLGGRAGARVE
jgi:hypothetical protein